MVSNTLRPLFTPGKDPVPFLQEAGLAPGPVWTGRNSRPHRDSIPGRPTRSHSLYRLSCKAYGIFKCLLEFLENLFKIDVTCILSTAVNALCVLQF